MGLVLFFSVSVLMAILLVLFRNRTITMVITSGFALMHIGLSVYAWANLNETVLSYFTFDSPGVILLTVLSVIIIPTVYHGFIMHHREIQRNSTSIILH